MNASRTARPRRPPNDSALAVVNGQNQPGRRARTSDLEARARERLGAELMGVCVQALRQFGVTSTPAGKRLSGIRRATYARRLLIYADRAVTVHTRWQRQANYLDEEGHPRVIPIQGPAPSFEALCRDCGVGHESQQLLALACQFGLCSRVAGNRLSHIADVLLMMGHPTLMLARAAVTTERFLRTCVHNAKPGRTFSESLGDRTAEVDLSEEEFARLSKATRRYLSSFIESSDRQLLAGVVRDRRKRRPVKTRRRSGVTAFVFRD